MAEKCELCGGRMRKWSDPFNVHWTCEGCGNEDMISKSFKLPKELKGGRK